ncbi:MAG TPA: YceI family protein [Cytophagaceae bacterium]|jgi:polyisoprenoid-binding protein YceI|nr:YceI family protein [Cytophagaceae bacterium]
MKKVTLITAVAVSAFLLSFKILEPATWTIDKAHAKLGFAISHLMVSEVEGSFKITSATVSSTKDDFTDAVVELTADAATVNTENEQRDTHLKSADFFDVAKFPTITFKSTSFTKVADKKYKVKGNLTLHGVTKPVELEAIANTGVNPMSKKTIAGFKVTGKIKRADFGIAPSMASAMLGEEVSIIANAEFSKN